MSLISHCLDLIGAFVAVYVITTGYYFISKILCCTIMVVIQCPHCSLSVELDDGVSGLFDCPHCGEDFQWGEIDEEIDHNIFTWLDWAASKIYLQFGILIFLYPLALFFDDVFLPIISVWVVVPLASFYYRRDRRRYKHWKSS